MFWYDKSMKYVALLRGISPLNPNMRNERLRKVFENLGFQNVQTVISSGNVLFETTKRGVAELEKMIEEAITEQLGFHSTTIIRSLRQLQQLAKRNPFKNHEHNQKTYLTVTFLRDEPHTQHGIPAGRGYEIIDRYDRTIFSVVDLTSGKTPDLMVQLDKGFGKHLTTRTWKTVERIVKRFE